MNKDNRLLREYIRESLNEAGSISSAFGDVKSSAKGLGTTIAKMFSGGKGAKSGPEKWFEDFMKQQLDKTGKHISGYLSSKLDAFLPDEVKKAISDKKLAKGKSDGSTNYDELAKVINAFIKSAEKSSGKEIPQEKVDEITDFAAEEFAKAAKGGDVKSAMKKVQTALALKYGPQVKSSK